MSWKECSVVDERLRFIARKMDGERMSDLCREFGISRKTGYKIWNRYQECGIEALTDRKRRPYRYANQLPLQLEIAIVETKRSKSTWGAPKIRERLIRKYPDIHPPATSTVHAILDRHGLVKRRRRKRNHKPTGTPLSNPNEANDLWCTDYKGEFMLGNKQYCYPLTITDYASRFIIACEGMYTNAEKYAFTVFERVFREYGLPRAIRSDNGVPFATSHGFFNLSKLSVWWLRLGIQIERIKPGNPQQNGRHERMHLTLKKEATKPAGMNLLQQQEKFDRFIEEYNQQRPHQALEMKYPCELYERSHRAHKGLEELFYPFHDKTITVTSCGRICHKNLKIHLSQVFAGQNVGITQVSDKIWLVSFMDYDLGYFDEQSRRMEPLENPFSLKVLPMSRE